MIFGANKKKSEVREFESTVRERIKGLVAKLRDPSTPEDEKGRIADTLRKLNARCDEESRSVRKDGTRP
jgi:hypothetical protein